MFTILHHATPILLSLTCCKGHTKDRFISVTEVISFLIFGRIWIGTVDLCVYGNSGSGLDHYDDEIH